jgi:uncharacterized protein (TIGR02266 family)
MAGETENRYYPRAKINWLVTVKSPQGVMEGITVNVSPTGVYIQCQKPLKLNEVFELAIRPPKENRTLTATAEVIWSNIYGPDDEISPRGMGVRFLNISSEDRKFIAKAVLDQLKSKKLEPKFLETLRTIVIE